jgi:hypothetical protein
VGSPLLVLAMVLRSFASVRVVRIVMWGPIPIKWWRETTKEATPFYHFSLLFRLIFGAIFISLFLYLFGFCPNHDIKTPKQS